MQEDLRKWSFVYCAVILDGALLFLLLFIAYKIRTESLPSLLSGLPTFKHPLKQYLWLVLIYLLIMAYKGAYTKRFTFWDEVKMLWTSTGITAIAVLFVLFATKQTQAYSRILILEWLFLCLLVMPVLRTKVKSLLHQIGLGKIKILIIGAGENGIRFMKAIQSEPNLGLEIAGFVDDSTKANEIEGIKVYRYMNSIERYIKNSGIRAIAIAGMQKSAEELSQFINKIYHNLETVFYVPEIKDIPVIGTETRYFLKSELLVLEIKNNLERPLNYFLKRFFDYSVSILLLPVIMPLIILFSIIIKLTSPGPVIFSQERIGKNGKTFRCYKFRTMHLDADRRLKELLENDPKAREEWQKTWKLKNDPRITPFGKFLRKTSLDEIPQIFNVLKREMSLIGPRPVVREELERFYKENSTFYCMIPPGITGLWQVSGRSNTTYEERVSLDCWYVRNWSLWLDLVILLKTIKIVFKREGAY